MGAALYLAIALLLGIIYLMTTKPMLEGAILAMIIAATLGLSAFPLWFARRHMAQSKNA